jgi:hypothetical protein
VSLRRVGRRIDTRSLPGVPCAFFERFGREELRSRRPFQIAFGNQTISLRATSNRFREIHGFAPLPRGRFAFIGAIIALRKIAADPLRPGRRTLGLNLIQTCLSMTIFFTYL